VNKDLWKAAHPYLHLLHLRVGISCECYIFPFSEVFEFFK
jgi:hypothetical protein